MELVEGSPGDTAGRPEKEIRVYRLLDALDIRFQRIDHESVNTMEASAEINSMLDAIVCKNLFLWDSKKEHFYLLMVAGDKKFRSGEIAGQIGSTRLSFAPAEYMEAYLDITPGSVSIMGLMNDREKHVELLVDEEVPKAEYLGCHPCVNTASLRIKTKDVLERFLPAVGHAYRTVHMDEE